MKYNEGNRLVAVVNNGRVGDLLLKSGLGKLFYKSALETEILPSAQLFKLESFPRIFPLTLICSPCQFCLPSLLNLAPHHSLTALGQAFTVSCGNYQNVFWLVPSFAILSQFILSTASFLCYFTSPSTLRELKRSQI